MFHVVRLELNDRGEPIRRTVLQPFYELRDDAVAMAEFDASHCWGEYGYDPDRDCWWATDQRDNRFRFVVQASTEIETAA
jgi:hypothetical protein